MDVKRRLRILMTAVLLVVMVPASVGHAAGPLCWLGGRVLVRVLGGIAVAIVSEVAATAIMGGNAQAQTVPSSHGSNRSTATRSTNRSTSTITPDVIDSLETHLTPTEVTKLHAECSNMGGVFPSSWNGIGEESFTKNRVIFFHNYQAKSNHNGGGICLRY